MKVVCQAPKMLISQTSVKFLEFIINTEEIKMQLNRMRTVLKWLVNPVIIGSAANTAAFQTKTFTLTWRN